jgi:hypothetical protein
LLRRYGCGLVDVGGRKRKKSRIEARKVFMLCPNLMYRAGQKKGHVWAKES